MPTWLRAALSGAWVVLLTTVAAGGTSAFTEETSLTLRESGDASPTSDADPFAKGEWVFTFYGSGSVGESDGSAYLAHAGVGYHILEAFSVNLEGFGGFLDVSGGEEDSVAEGLDLILRWHFFRGSRWSAYVDGGAGLIWSENPFPPGGTHQNFTPQGGAGITVDLGERVDLMTGARLFHLSNASKSGEDDNPGHNALMYYAGVMIPF